MYLILFKYGRCYNTDLLATAKDEDMSIVLDEQLNRTLKKMDCEYDYTDERLSVDFRFLDPNNDNNDIGIAISEPNDRYPSYIFRSFKVSRNKGYVILIDQFDLVEDFPISAIRRVFNDRKTAEKEMKSLIFKDAKRLGGAPSTCTVLSPDCKQTYRTHHILEFNATNSKAS